MITRDNALVAAHIGKQVGLTGVRVLRGGDLSRMSEDVLIHVVGYMGDGINDASALHAADVSISVADAVDVAKDAADIVLLKQDLKVLLQGTREGRRPNDLP